MRLFFRLIEYARTYWRRLPAALVCIVLFMSLGGLYRCLYDMQFADDQTIRSEEPTPGE